MQQGIINEIYLQSEIPGVDEALQDVEWRQAMKKEIDSFAHHKVFTIVKRTPEMKIIGGKWILSTKEGVDGAKIKKARYVA